MEKAMRRRKTLLENFRKNNILVNEEKVVVKMDDEAIVGQKDLYEGVYCTISGKNTDLEKIFNDALVTDISLRAEGYRYRNVHCYYRLDYYYNDYGIEYNTNDSMNSFGDYVIIIDDEIEFLRRLNKAMMREKFDYLCGNVRYRPPMKDGKYVKLGPHIIVKSDEAFEYKINNSYNMMVSSRRDSFDKMAPMSYQNEWRISLYREIKDCSAYILDMQCSLKDIAHVIKTEKLNEELENIFKNKRYKPGLDCAWYGNISRRELREKFYALGDNKMVMIGTIGMPL